MRKDAFKVDHGGITIKIKMGVQNVHHNNFRKQYTLYIIPHLLPLIYFVQDAVGARKLLEKRNSSNQRLHKTPKPLYIITSDYFNYIVNIIH